MMIRSAHFFRSAIGVACAFTALTALTACNRNSDMPAGASSPPVSSSTSGGVTPDSGSASSPAMPDSTASSAAGAGMAASDSTTPALGTPSGGDGSRASSTASAPDASASPSK